MENEVLKATITIAELTQKMTKGGKKRQDGTFTDPLPYQSAKCKNNKTWNMLNGTMEMQKTYDIEYEVLQGTYEGKPIQSKWIKKLTPQATPQPTPQEPIMEKAKEVFKTSTQKCDEFEQQNKEEIRGLCEPREVLEIKEKLSTMDKTYENQAIKVARIEAKFKKTEAIYESENAKKMMVERELRRDAKESEIKNIVEDKMIQRRIDLIGVEAEYKFQKAILESLDKSIQLLRNRADILVAEIYSNLHLDKISNMRTIK